MPVFINGVDQGGDIVNDTTPQLGGTLDMQANTLAGNGGTTGITISANGEVTMTAQPAVLAYNSATDLNVTGDATTATIDLDTEVFDQNADFATDTFTAPVAGRYLISFNIHLAGLTSAETLIQGQANASNRLFQELIQQDGTLTEQSVGGSPIIDMDASDTVTIRVIASNGTKVVDIQGAADIRTSISVCLLA